MSTARVDFTRGAAERIARVVRIVETGERDQAPLTFKKPVTDGGGGGSRVRIGTFSGSWGTGASKTITFLNQTSTPNTVTAINIFSNISVDCGQRNCAIAKDGTAWYLIAAQCS